METIKYITIFYIITCLPYAITTNTQRATKFDLLIYTQQWPATTCKEWKKNDPSHTCSMPKNVDSWTIHGIWPTKLGSMGPAFCNRTWLFDPEKIRPIENQLSQVWINIFGGTSLYSLWAHEWNKHGTCAAVLEPLNSELKYFSFGIDLLQNFSMTNILQSENIVPSNTKEYSVVEINNAIKQKLGVDPAIECKKENGESYLAEIRICFTKDFKITNCDGIMTRKVVDYHSVLTNCNLSKKILYPHYKDKSFYVQIYKLISWLQWFTL
ncbi:unnamed protein product [Euphydryas editha]|uniref:Uncharacterized protein n=1 Tax=Euphydryas editha TaxID=104508 RepID=A0AAU9VFR3_EUPED|nr:unnamed protein product [Euphydryas editha]